MWIVIILSSHGWMKPSFNKLKYLKHYKHEISKLDIFFQSIAGPFFTSVCRSTRTLWSRHCWDYDNTELTVFFQSCLNTKRPPPHLPFLVCADSQRSGASQLWKLVSMETRVGRRVMMLLAEQQYRINHVLQCVVVWMCGDTGDKQTD